ncbi:MAG: hypothetical protein ACKVX7_03610 [Planctomycetota bacterium]
MKERGGQRVYGRRGMSHGTIVLSVSCIAVASVLLWNAEASPRVAAESVTQFLQKPTGEAPPAAAEKDAVVVLADGTELNGTIIEETDTHVTLRTPIGVSKIARTKIKEIRSGNPAMKSQFDERFARASSSKDVAALLELAEWARVKKNLNVEYERALRKVIELDADNATARKELGYARLDGKWIEPREVQNLLLKDYELVGLDLRKRTAPAPNAPKPEPTVPQPGPLAPKPEGATGPNTPGSGTPPANGGATDTGTPDITKLLPPAALTGKLTDEERTQREKKRAATRPASLEKYKAFCARKRREHEGVEWSQRYVKNTQHYKLTTNVSEDVSRVYMTLLEWIYAELGERFTDRSVTSQKSDIFIYRSQADFMAENPNVGPGTGAFFQPASKQVHGFHGVFSETNTTLGVLCHELTHQFESIKLPNMDNLPAWLIEGMAVYLGDGARLDPERGITVGLIPRDRLLHMKAKIADGTHSKLRPLVALEYRQLNGSLYSDVWSLCYFLFAGPDNKTRGRPFIIQYWLWIKERKVFVKDFEELAMKHFGGMAELEKQWIDFTKTIQPEAIGVVSKDVFESDDFRFKVRLPAPRWQYRLKDLEHNELVVMEVPGTDVKIRANMRNKPDYEQSLDDYAREFLEKPLEANYADVKREGLNFYGGQVLKYTYRDMTASERAAALAKALAKSGGKTIPPVDPADQAKAKALDKPELARKYCHYLFVGFNGAYSLVGSAPTPVFDEFAVDFEEAARDLELIPKNRW